MRTIVSPLAEVPRRFPGCLVLVAVLCLVSSRPTLVRAQGIYEPRHPSRYSESGDSSDEWREHRIFFAGAAGLPASFPGGWSGGIGGSLGFGQGVADYADLMVDLEQYTFRFDDSKLRARGATWILGHGPATFGDVAFGLRLYAPTFGSRVYGLFEFALPYVSRPVIQWKDASGDHEVRGTDIFGLDFGYVIGFGFEKVEAHKFGLGVESRFVIAPGTTEPGEYLVSIRAGVSVPVPVDW